MGMLTGLLEYGFDQRGLKLDPKLVAAVDLDPEFEDPRSREKDH